MRLLFSDLIFKLFFLISLIPFIISERVQEKFDLRLNSNIEDSLFSSGKKVAVMEKAFLSETSGIVVSRKHPGIMYIHNDSGNDPEVYLLDSLGDYAGRITLKNTINRDFEDIAIGPGPIKNKDYIYIGDIGDNASNHKELYLYRFAEPNKLQKDLEIEPEKFTIKYPDGPKDSETLMVDPWNGDVFLLSKRDSSNVLYKAPASAFNTEDPIVLEKVMTLPITMSTAGDISADGTQVLIKNYWTVYYWTREEGQSLEEALAKKPTMLPYKPEPQGEAIGFAPDGNSFFTLSEQRFRITPVLYKYTRK
ncbi:hypothetical protein [Anditalea andensis]|uniref:Membrane protein n=1 Tax=Anditalea andensis TaxID=1048983 RepID=A0A074LMR9_9BACT|nr:hypothetical protein [Anditalea andensis]KEO75177.1 membrane protein [Anditalea andensis]